MNSQERGEPKRQRWKTVGKYLTALVLGGIVALVLDYGVSQLAGEPPRPPRPVDNPFTMGSTGQNDRGVQYSVSEQPLDDGSVRVNGTVTDTEDDGRGVKLELVPVDAEDEPRSPLVVVNNEGAGSSVGLGPGGARTDHVFRGDTKEISVRACVFDRAGEQRLHELECEGGDIILPKRP